METERNTIQKLIKFTTYTLTVCPHSFISVLPEKLSHSQVFFVKYFSGYPQTQRI